MANKQKQREQTEKKIAYALILTATKTNKATSYASTSNTDLAIKVIDGAPLDMLSVFSKCHIITINEAIDFVQNAYWANHSASNRHELDNLKQTHLVENAEFCYYRINGESHRKNISCSLVTFGDIMQLIKTAEKKYNLSDKNIHDDYKKMLKSFWKRITWKANHKARKAKVA